MIDNRKLISNLRSIFQFNKTDNMKRVILCTNDIRRHSKELYEFILCNLKRFILMAEHEVKRRPLGFNELLKHIFAHLKTSTHLI
ncbi:hypothetical protein HERIO_1238 [Hepatospora eriocheir]|uniref:Uncharacterized protein n=1 Tax=Hepatospora eriocheir TaxID=1081669 RepID=A0A1X0QAS1_9MICR|nr:hypothetical protein HERIO_1238 [Hepatospora eriocheir]